MKNNYEFNVSKNTFKNIFYSWRRNSKLFSWYSIFDNSYTKDRTLYLKDVSNSYIYNSKGDNMYWHRHIIWVSNYNIKRIRYSLHYYLDATYVSSKEFYELLILMYCDNNSKKKIPGAYILLNSKYENSFILVLKAL